MNRYLPLGVAAVLMLAVAVVQGYWTDRWGKQDSQEILKRADSLKQVPLEFGRWKGVDTKLDEKQMKVAKVSGVIQRTYRHADTGAEVSIYLATGKARNIAVHTPDKCYAAAGFRMAEDQIPVPIKYGDNAVANFFAGHFRKDESSGALHLQIYWTWNAFDKWEAPQLPKFAFANANGLYKLYAIRQMTGADVNMGSNPTIDFLKEFLPILDRVLYEPGHEAPTSPPAAATQPAAA